MTPLKMLYFNITPITSKQERMMHQTHWSTRSLTIILLQQTGASWPWNTCPLQLLSGQNTSDQSITLGGQCWQYGDQRKLHRTLFQSVCLFQEMGKEGVWPPWFHYRYHFADHTHTNIISVPRLGEARWFNNAWPGSFHSMEVWALR